MDGKKKKRIIIWALVGVFAAILLSSASCKSTYAASGTGECLSIVFFEKFSLKKVDKVVLTYPSSDGKEKAVTITDQELVRQVVEETAVATRANYSDHISDKCRIDLYDGDDLVRSMLWSDSAPKSVKVYDSDLTHWLIVPPFVFWDNEGWVELSDELYQKLMATLGES